MVADTPVLCTQTPGGVTEDEYVDLLTDRGVAGIIFVSGMHADVTADHAAYTALVDRGLPIVLVNGYAERHGAKPNDARLKNLDLQYHDLRADRCLALRVGLDTLVEPAAVTTAMTTPPDTTRAYFRGRCLAKWPDDVVAANWDSLVFDVGRDPLRRVPMMEPLRGTAESVQRLIDESSTPAELLAKLGA